MKRFIYADNAATTKLDSDALNEMLPWLQDEYGNASQPYTFARKPRKALSEARTTIASCIGAQPEEIYFTSGGTERDITRLQVHRAARISGCISSRGQ